MKTADIRFLCAFVAAWFIGVFMGLPFFLALLIIWKGIFGKGVEATLWGLAIGTLLGILMWPLAFWWPLVMGATGLALYLLRRYLILKLTPVTITLFVLLSLFFWYIILAIIQSRFPFSPFHFPILFDVVAASILINLCYAIFCQKKGAHQPRLWDRPSRGIIRPVRL